MIANLLLASGLLESWLSRPGTEVSLGAAFTLIPSRVILRDVRVKSGEAHSGWSLSADRVDADIEVFASMSGRRLSVGKLVAQGAELRILSDAASRTPETPAAPGGPGLRVVRMEDPAFRPGAGAIVLRDVVVHLDEILLLGFRYVGGATAQGSVRVADSGTRMRAAVELHGGAVRDGPGIPFARDLRGVLHVHREGPRGSRGWRPWSAEVALDARIESAANLGRRANATISGGAGPLNAKLTLHRGVLQPNSRIEYATREAAAHAGGLTATGALEARFVAGKDGVRFVADWTDVRVSPRARPVFAPASSERIRFVLHADSDLNDGVGFTGVLEPTTLVVPDLRLLNHLEREGRGWVVSGGSGELMLTSRHASGCAFTLRARLERAELRLGTLDMAGNFQLDTRFEARRCAARHGVLTETVLSATDVTLGPPEHRTRAFSANARLESARVRDWSIPALTSAFDTRLDSTAPLLRAISSGARLPAWVDLLVGSGDLAARGVVSSSPKALDVHVAAGHSGRTAIRGRFLRTAEGKRTVLLMQRAPVSAGLELSGRGLELQFVGTEQWFESKLATLPRVGGAR